MKYPMILGLALTLGTSFTIPSAHATGAEGHGGNVVICNQNRDFYLLDYVEATGPKNDLSYPSRKISVPSITGSVDSIVQAYLKNMRDNLDPRGTSFMPLAKKMLSDVKNFQDSGKVTGEVISFAYRNLPDTLDAHEFQLPIGCEKKQLIVRDMQSNFAEDQQYIRKFMIDPQYWIHLDAQQKALAIMHELFYDNLAIEYKQDNSRNARYLNEHNASLITDQCGWANLVEVAKSPIQYKNLSPSFTLRSADFLKNVVCENGRIAKASNLEVLLNSFSWSMNHKLEYSYDRGILNVNVRFLPDLTPVVESFKIYSAEIYELCVSQKLGTHSEYLVTVEHNMQHPTLFSVDVHGNSLNPITIRIPQLVSGLNNAIATPLLEAFGSRQIMSLRNEQGAYRRVRSFNDKNVVGNFHFDLNTATLQIEAELNEFESK